MLFVDSIKNKLDNNIVACYILCVGITLLEIVMNEEFSLRERKQAYTKIALLKAFIERLKDSRFDDISIKEICAEVQVSEGTFFNYFPQKMDVINYYVHLLFVKVYWSVRKEHTSGQFLDLIDSMVERFSGELRTPNTIYQILTTFMLQNNKPNMIEISRVEKKVAFNDLEGIEDVPSMQVVAFFRECLLNARGNAEIPADANIEDLVVSLLSILTGTLMATKFDNCDKRAYHYTRQLKILWDSIRVKRDGA